MIAVAAAVGFTACENEFDYPPVECPPLGEADGANGSAELPFNINGIKAYYTAYYSEVPDAGTYYWATGYIVGCAATTETVFVANDATSQFEAPFGSATNILLADNPDETDYTKCISVQLPSGPIRNDLNLADNPANHGRQVTLHGYIDKYVGIAGLRSVDAYNWGSEGIPGMEPVIFKKVSAITSGKGYALVAFDGSNYAMAKPAPAGSNYGWLYCTNVTPSNGVIKGEAANAFMFTAAATEGQYYIVDSQGRYLYMEGTYNSFQLATSLQEGNNNFLWMPVLDPASDTWTITNVGNAKVIQYFAEKSSYGAYPTISDGYFLPTLYELDGEMELPGEQPGDQPGGDEPGGDEPGDDPATGDGNGSESNPYTTAQVIALNPTSTSESPAGGAGVWVKGFIVGSMPTGGSSTLLSNTEFSTANAATTNIVIGPSADCKDASLCVGIQLPTESNAPGVRSALNLVDNPGNLGKEISLYGDVMKYCGGPGLKNTSKFILDGQGGGSGDEPGGDDPAPSTLTDLYKALNESDAALSAGWTIDNVTLPDALDYIWDWKTYNGKSYLNGSGYKNSPYATEAWAVSAVIDLTGATDCTLAFDHAAKFQTTLRDLCGVYARVEGSSSWTKLTIPTWPDAGAWTFANSGEISLAAFNGKKIEIGFKYASSTSGADTWEIKNLVVKGKK